VGVIEGSAAGSHAPAVDKLMGANRRSATERAGRTKVPFDESRPRTCAPRAAPASLAGSPRR